jgi:hypothetical protein
MKVTYTKNLTKIFDSYKMKDVESEVKEIIEERARQGYPVTRTLQSYVKETKAHNRLYKLGLFRSHTKDVDLEENIEKKTECVWKILGR